MEVWRSIRGYDGFYEVSNLGKVKSLSRVVSNGLITGVKRERILKHKIDNYGYPCVVLCVNAVRKYVAVHRLVADAFLVKPLFCDEVNHKNFNKTDNCVDNLEWVSREYNHHHAVLGGMANACKCVGKFTPDGILVNEFKSICSAAKSIGVDSKRISHVCRGKAKSCKGFVWKFL